MTYCRASRCGELFGVESRLVRRCWRKWSSPVTLRNTTETYGPVSKLNHWRIALRIIGLIWLGWYMVDLTYYHEWQKFSLMAHRALGMVVLLLAALKIAWVIGSKLPDFVGSQKPWERAAASATHHLLYLVMLLVPLTGYIISTSNGDPIPFFGWFDIPALFTAGTQVRDIAIDVHYYLAYAVAVIVLMHAAGALKHQFIVKDGTLGRIV